jgi:short subunit dehydrogenase-like uncharacterized protein
VRARGKFVVRLLGERTADPPGRLLAIVGDDHDPGHGSTSRMLGESALCLAKDDLAGPGGVLTPAAAMGTALLDRLRAIGMRWDVGDAPA